MKMKKATLVFIFILGVFLFTACNAAEEPTTGDPVALAGFVEIHDNNLYITPVEVFMLYEVTDSDGHDSIREGYFVRIVFGDEVYLLFEDYSNKHDVFQDPALRSVVFIERSDNQKLAELGLTIEDFPSGICIRPNWHAVYQWHYVEQALIQQLSFAITSDTEFVFIDSERNLRNTNELTEFLPYLYPTVVHFIEVYDDRVTRLVQEFWFTM